VVGRDTRMSSAWLQAALSAGAAAEGVDVWDLGVLPTPGVARVAAASRCPGAVISASHNPFYDNGVKLFGPGGTKLDDTSQAQVEELLGRLLAEPAASREPGGLQGAALGRLRPRPDAPGEVVESTLSSLGGRSLAGAKVVLDCANGAAVVTAAEVFSRAGAEVLAVLGDSPDGTNINAGCGSTDPGPLSDAVRSLGADLGLAFDGDADRVIAVDERGTVVDGDRLLALFALDLHRRGLLPGATVVVTVMTNLGFKKAMAKEGIAVHETPVGDRQVLAALESHGWSLGGEQSGHIVFRDLATTGDGVLSGLLLVDLLRRAGRRLSELASGCMSAFPQVLANVEVADPGRLAEAALVWDQVRAEQARLGGSGRVLIRPSGTERLVRVMVEASSAEMATQAAERLVSAVRLALG